MVRKIFITLILLLTFLIGESATYYVSATGNDSNNGTSTGTPWKTLTKVSSFTYANGDIILFKRGDRFEGTLTLTKSSTTSRVIYGAYGTGAKPIISSLKTLSGWTLHSGKIYKVAASIPANCNAVTINDVYTNIGKYPQNGENTFESSTMTSRNITVVADYSGTVAGTIVLTTSAAHGLTNGTMVTILNSTSYNGYYSATVVNSTQFYITKTFVSSQTGTLLYNTTITDNQLTGTPDWLGAEVVIWKSNWTLDRGLITNHSTTTLRYISGSSYDVQASGGMKYYIQKDIDCLTYQGAWFCDGSYFYMYFQNNDPENYTVRAGLTDHTVYLDRKNYNTLRDLRIEGGNLYGIYCISSTFLSVLNCDIINTGITGATIITNAITGASNNTLIDSCAISYSGGTGIWMNSEASRVSNSTFNLCGQYAGLGAAGGGSHYGLYTKGIGNITEYNVITNTGYLPIYWESNNAIVRYNKVDTYPTLGLNDGGGIYTFSSSAVNSGQKCHNNIIMNSTANGLYSDGLGNHIEFYSNLVLNVDKWGIHMNEPVGNDVHDNTFYDFGLAGFDVSNQYYAGAVASSNVVTLNTFVQQNSTQKFLSYQDNNTNNAVLNFGTSDYNRFIGDPTLTTVFYNQKGSATSLPYSAISYTFNNWKALTNKEANSTLTTYDLGTISVIYNDTRNSIVYPITGYKKDLNDVVYNSEEGVPLAPFTSMVLRTYVPPTPPTPTIYKKQKGPTGKYQIYNGKIQLR